MKKLITLLLLMGLAVQGLNARSLDITISGGTEGASPIAVVPFGMEGGSPPAENVAQIIAADLQRSGRFKPLPEKDMVAHPHSGAEVQIRDWSMLGLHNLVVGNVTGSGGGVYQVRFELLNANGQQLLGYNLTTQSRDLRATAHQIADMIYEKLTGEPGAFNTRVAYITSISQGPNRRPKIALQVADADGHNPLTIVTSQDPLMSPAWSPDGRRIAYVSFEKMKPAIYVQDVFSGKRRQVSSFKGINGAPAWSPDGTKLAMTLSKDGNPDVYIYALDSGSLSKITDHYAIDTEASWAPDGRSLVFTSDRGGKPQIYQVSAQGGTPKRITFSGDYNARASFSPDGRKLAMVTRAGGGGFNIGVMDVATGSVQVLTNGRLDESPSFAPNGSMIMYATKNGRKGELAAVSVDGRVKQRLLLQAGDVREPDWAPIVK
jgi:TolB protein